MVRKSGNMPRREEFLAAALARIARDGYAATSTRLICADLGLAHSAIYNYFPSKEAVLLAIEERDVTAIIADLEDIAARTSGVPGHRLLGMIAYLFRQAAQRRAAWRLLAEMLRSVSPKARVAIVERRDRVEGFVVDALVEAQKASMIATPDARMSTLHLFGMAEGMSNWYRPNGKATEAVVVDGATRFFLSAVNATPELFGLWDAEKPAKPARRRPSANDEGSIQRYRPRRTAVSTLA